MEEDFSQDWLSWVAQALRLQGLVLPLDRQQSVARTLARLGSALVDKAEAPGSEHANG